ncbi:MAG: hypothetical protein CR991_08800 [Proteobacteria bacterium]|nr:MAG: hypothetical protein CR991_08800 [Pseudomonadota bacterium]
MKKKFVALAVFAGLGVSACSHNPQTHTTADNLSKLEQVKDTPRPNKQSIAQNQPQTPAIPQALPLTQQRVVPAHQRPQKVAVNRPQQAYHHRRPTRAQSNIHRPARPQQALHIPVINHHYQPPQNQYTMTRSLHTQNVMPRLSRAELQAIGDQIFNNEGGGNIYNLAHWNAGEDFASMGIGHFTWYPAGRRQTYGNTFPGLLDYMQQNGVRLPAWLQQARRRGAPWRTRQEFFRAKNTPQMQALQQLLYATRDLQAQYIVDRTRRAMPKLVKASNSHMQGHVARNLNAVANTPGGWYALIDYVNFKGEGLGGGGYKGHSWGLRQVLEEMRPTQPGQRALNEFADAAMRVLYRRVRNSDPARNEKKWLPGWQNRVNTYRTPIA